MLVKQMSFRQIFIVHSLTAIQVNFGVALYCGVGTLIQLCQQYQLDVSDVLFGLSCLLPWSEDVPALELFGVVVLIMQYSWFCVMVELKSKIWRMPAQSSVVNIPDYDLRVNLSERTCSRRDGILWRCAIGFQYEDCCWGIVTLHLVLLVFIALTTSQISVEFSASFLPTVTFWDVGSAASLYAVAQSAIITTQILCNCLTALAIAEIFNALRRLMCAS